MDKFTKSLNFPAKNAGFLFLQHNYLLSPRQTYSSDLYTLGIIIAKHKIRNTMPPHIIYCIPICAITIPQTADPKAVPKLAAVKKKTVGKIRCLRGRSSNPILVDIRIHTSQNSPKQRDQSHSRRRGTAPEECSIDNPQCDRKYYDQLIGRRACTKHTAGNKIPDDIHQTINK